MSIDFLYYSLALGFLVLVGFISYAMYQLGQTLKSVQRITNGVEHFTHDLQITKERMKLSALNVIMGLISLFRRRR